MIEKFEGSIISLISTILVGLFIYIFGLPSSISLIIIGSIYLVGILLLIVVVKEEIFGVSRRLIKIYSISHLAMFIIYYFLLRQSLNLSQDHTYSIIFLLLYTNALIVFLFCQINSNDKRNRFDIGHASTSVCFKQEQDCLYTYLVFNRNHNLWLLPGGHLDILKDDPYLMAKQRILTELGFESKVLESDGFETGRFESTDILNGCHAFYRVRSLPSGCHDIHFDFAFVSILEKQIADPKYKYIRIDITNSKSSNDIDSALRVAINNHYKNVKHEPIPAETYPADIPDRIYSGLLYYRSVWGSEIVK